MSGGEGAKAVALVEQFLNGHPDDPEARSAARDILSHSIPSWHGAMLADDERSEIYARAIARAVSGGKTLLDIGAGSGLLSLIAARAGASAVYACEANGALAATAQEIVAINGFGEKIRVLNKHSTELDAEGDLLGGVDVIVGEVFSNDLLCEHALRTFQDATARLARNDAQIIPAKAAIRVALAYREGHSEPALSDVQGFDLSLFRKHLPSEAPVSVASKTLHLRSEPADLFSFDLQAGSAFTDGRVELSLTCRGGPANGVVRWIRLTMDDHDTYENLPGCGRKSHWSALFVPLPAGEIASGNMVSVHAGHDREHLHMWFP
jgi:type II protein arginine methyltransferase